MKQPSVLNQPVFWYWRSVLEEVLNKHNPKYPLRFTSFRDSAGLLASEADSPDYEAGGFQRFYLNIEKPGVYLTAQEGTCMYAILRGKNLRETADDMGLSIRTIEYYIKNLKRKTGCRKRSELLGLVLGSNFMGDYEARVVQPRFLREPELKNKSSAVNLSPASSSRARKSAGN